MKPRNLVHITAASLALLCIAAFWTSTVVSELFLSGVAVAMVKDFILKAMWLLIPALMATGASGFSLAQQRGGTCIQAKKRRMRLTALNGLVILLPSAIFLRSRAAAGNFDEVFYAVQVLELLAGAFNLAMLGANFRDGLQLAGRLKKAVPRRMG